MNDCVKKKANKAFNAIILNKNSTIDAVVKEPFFRSKLKSPNKILIEYLNEDQTIDQICDWLLSEEYCMEKNYKPISQLIIRIFKEAPEKVLVSFSSNQKLIYRLQRFCKFEKKYFVIGFGHFQQIIELLCFSTKGVFLQNFDDFSNTLMKCIDVISIRYLFLSLASNFTQAFGFSKDVVLKMIQSMNDSNQHHIIFLLSKLSKEKNTYFAFDHSKVIYSLFEIVTSPSQNEFVITQALQIIDYVKKNTIIKEKVDIILKYFEPKIDFDNLPVNFSTSIILKLYNYKFIPSLIMLMINNPTHMFLHEGVMESIKSASDEVLIDFIEKNNVPIKLMWAMNVAKSNGFLTKFAAILNEKRNLSTSLQTPEWDSFVSNVLNKRLLIMSDQYSHQFFNANSNSQENSNQKKGQKRSNSVQLKKSQQQLNDKNKAKSDDEDKYQIAKKEDKKRKEKNKKRTNEQQIENKEDNSDRTGKIRTEKIKKSQQNENKEDNSENVGKVIEKIANENNKIKTKSKNKKKCEEVSNKKLSNKNNLISNNEETSNKEDSTFLANNENNNKNILNSDKATQNDQNQKENVFDEKVEENKSGETANSPLPKILDSLLIKNLILQRLNKNENENNLVSEKTENPDDITQNNDFQQTLIDNSFELIHNENNETSIDITYENKIVNDSNDKEENEEDRKQINENNEINLDNSKNVSEIKSPPSNKKHISETNVQLNSPKSNDMKNKNEQLKTPVKQSHEPGNYEPSIRSTDHCRIALIKRKLYRNNEQSPQPRSPKDEKSRVRSYSVNWSPSSTQPNTNSKSDDPNENEKRHKISNLRRIKRNNDMNDAKEDHPEIKKIDFVIDDIINGSTTQNLVNNQANIDRNRKIFDLEDDFSSSSDEESRVCYSNNPNIIGPSPVSYFRHTIFGPAYFPNNTDNNESSSDSSDGEFEFRFTPIPKRIKRKPSFNYRGTFSSIYN